MNELSLIPSKDQLVAMTEYSERIAGCGLFPVKNAAEAFGMLQLSVADNIPCVRVFQKYHLIPNRKGGVEPALKSAWIMAAFCQQGGRFDWEDTGNPNAVKVKVTAKNGSSITISKSIAEMRAAGRELGPAWKANPSQMLRYRCAVDGVKAVAPDILLGMPADVDVEDRLPRRVESAVVERPVLAPAVAAALEPVEVKPTLDEVIQESIAEAPPEPQDEHPDVTWPEHLAEDDEPATGQDEAIQLADEDPAIAAAIQDVPEEHREAAEHLCLKPPKVEGTWSKMEPPPASKSTRPLGSVFQEISKRIKEAGLTPAQARKKASAVLGRDVLGVGDITAAEAQNLLGVAWK